MSHRGMFGIRDPRERTTTFGFGEGRVPNKRVAHLPCTYCGRRAGTMDHCVPKSAGGHVTVPACFMCNNLKGSMMPWEWWEWLAGPDGQAYLMGLPFTAPPASLRNPANTPPTAQRRTRRGCPDCGAKLPSHFTRCTSQWAKQNAALGVPSVG